ncbi:MAG: hypothetical protein ACPGVO_03915 [Spirulinaceae cyanobacterium]
MKIDLRTKAVFICFSVNALVIGNTGNGISQPVAPNPILIGYEDVSDNSQQIDKQPGNRDDTSISGDIITSNVHLKSDEPPDDRRNDTSSSGDILRTPLGLIILTPRNGNILGDRLTLRWSAVEGATDYTVFSEHLGLNEKVSDTMFDILIRPENELNPNQTYTVEITANIPDALRTEDTDVEGTDEITFNVLSPDQAAQLCNEVAAIEAVDERERILAIANLFNQENYQLNDDAIALLETYGQQFGFDEQITAKLDALYAAFRLNQNLRGLPEWTTGEIACQGSF